LKGVITVLLSKQQKYILDCLNTLGCLRKSQLEAMLKARFFPEGQAMREGWLNNQLRLLSYGNCELVREGETVSLPGRENGPQALEAIDVMLELSGGKPLEPHISAPGPVLLRFAVNGPKPAVFAVASRDICANGRGPPVFGDSERVVIMLSPGERPPELPITNPVFYALRQEDGKHRFFARNPTTH